MRFLNGQRERGQRQAALHFAGTRKEGTIQAGCRRAVCLHQAVTGNLSSSQKLSSSALEARHIYQPSHRHQHKHGDDAAQNCCRC